MSSKYSSYTAAQHVAMGKKLLGDSDDIMRPNDEGHCEADRSIQEAQAHFLAAQALNTLPAPAADSYASMTDEELWNSLLGERLRHYADKLLAAEVERIEVVAKKKDSALTAGGIGLARGIVSPLGTVWDREGDPWSDHRSVEIKGLRAMVGRTDGTTEAVQEAVKVYLRQASEGSE